MKVSSNKLSDNEVSNNEVSNNKVCVMHMRGLLFASLTIEICLIFLEMTVVKSFFFITVMKKRNKSSTAFALPKFFSNFCNSYD